MLWIVGYYQLHGENSSLNYDLNKIVDIIYIIEGKEKAKVPYGLINHKFTHSKRGKKDARKLCYSIVEKTYTKYKHEITRSKKRNRDFLEYLSDKYCPVASDKQGNINWLKNMRYYYAK